MTSTVSFDQLHDRLRTAGSCSVELPGSEAECFTRCCRRLDRVAALQQRAGLLGAIVGSLAMPFVFLANRRAVGTSQRLAAAVDLYVVARHRLRSVTGQRRDDEAVVVTFAARSPQNTV